MDMSAYDAMTIAELKALDPIEKAHALGEIWEEIAAKQPVIPLSQEEKALLDGRLAKYAKDPTTVPWAEVKSELLNSLEK